MRFFSWKMRLALNAVLLGQIATGCGGVSEDTSRRVEVVGETETQVSAPAKEQQQANTNFSKSIATTPNAGAYVAYQPKALYDSMQTNCSCHDFKNSLNDIKMLLAKNKPRLSLQDAIKWGRMPPNKPGFAKSAAGTELLTLLNKL